MSLRILLMMVLFMTLGLGVYHMPLVLNASQFCRGGETGYWEPVKGQNELIEFYLSRENDVLTKETVICQLRTSQKIMALPIEEKSRVRMLMTGGMK